MKSFHHEAHARPRRKEWTLSRTQGAATECRRSDSPAPPGARETTSTKTRAHKEDQDALVFALVVSRAAAAEGGRQIDGIDTCCPTFVCFVAFVVKALSAFDG
jgi:hypothetical protein